MGQLLSTKVTSLRTAIGSNGAVSKSLSGNVYIQCKRDKKDSNIEISNKYGFVVQDNNGVTTTGMGVIIWLKETMNDWKQLGVLLCCFFGFLFILYITWDFK